MSEMEIELTGANFDAETSSGVALIDFWAPWCGPCRAISPIVSEIASERGEAIKVCRANIDDDPSLAARSRVMSIPTLLVMRDGEEVERLIGARPKSDIDEMIDRALA